MPSFISYLTTVHSLEARPRFSGGAGPPKANPDEKLGWFCQPYAMRAPTQRARLICVMIASIVYENLQGWGADHVGGGS